MFFIYIFLQNITSLENFTTLILNFFDLCGCKIVASAQVLGVTGVIGEVLQIITQLGGYL
jgi:hypothetical protein